MLHTVIPRDAAASRSMDAFRGPVVTSSRSRGSCANSDAGNGVRSRIATMTSNGPSRSTSARSSTTWSANARTRTPGKLPQSAAAIATDW